MRHRALQKRTLGYTQVYPLPCLNPFQLMEIFILIPSVLSPYRECGTERVIIAQGYHVPGMPLAQGYHGHSWKQGDYTYGESPTKILNEDTHTQQIRVIGVTHTVCKDDFRRNLRSHRWSVF